MQLTPLQIRTDNNGPSSKRFGTTGKSMGASKMTTRISLTKCGATVSVPLLNFNLLTILFPLSRKKNLQDENMLLKQKSDTDYYPCAHTPSQSISWLMSKVEWNGLCTGTSELSRRRTRRCTSGVPSSCRKSPCSVSRTEWHSGRARPSNRYLIPCKWIATIILIIVINCIPVTQSLWTLLSLPLSLVKKMYLMMFPPPVTIFVLPERRLDKLTKAGLFHYWKTQDLPTRDPCNADSDFRERQLRNGDLMTTYILCGSGYLLAFITFVCECAHKYIFNRKSESTRVLSTKFIMSIIFPLWK